MPGLKMLPKKQLLSSLPFFLPPPHFSPNICLLTLFTNQTFTHNPQLQPTPLPTPHLATNPPHPTSIPMGCGGSKESKPDDNRRRLLLLGSSGAGKSTLFKQVKILTTKGFDDGNRLDAQPGVYQNMTEACKKLVAIGLKHNYKISEKTVESGEKLKSHDIDISNQATIDEFGKLIKQIWRDPYIKKSYKRSLKGGKAKETLMPNDVIFLDNVDRVCAPGYLPTDTDILNMRRSTDGAHTLNFTFDPKEFQSKNSSVNFTADEPSDWSITDVGGQIHERTTWYEEYTDCSGVIFVMGLSDFDQQSQDKRKTNKFVEDGINLMLEVAKVETLQGVPLIIMLNKKDLFEEKVRVSETGICATFPEYTGDKNDPKESLEFIEQLLSDIIEGGTSSESSIYVTMATDTNLIGNVLAGILQAITKQSLKEMGF